MVLAQMQSLLARLYDVPADHAVMDFLSAARPGIDVDEQVLVHETDDALHLSVFIAPEVIERLARRNPLQALNDANLADFCTALEGVSHFHYLTYRAKHAQPVSLLELELQAEVDKYAAAVRLLTAQSHGAYPRTLHERLFHHVGFKCNLSDAVLARYREANRCAARFCRRLDEAFLKCRRARPELWLRELRDFYRLSHSRKLQRAAL